jgi:hypothetical protein
LNAKIAKNAKKKSRKASPRRATERYGERSILLSFPWFSVALRVSIFFATFAFESFAQAR